MSKYLNRLLLIALIMPAACLRILAAHDKVDITLPTTVTFTVYNVISSTTGVPTPTPISYTNGNLHANMQLRISVMANAAACTPPGGGPTIPAGSFSWTAANTTGGIGYSGTLAYNAYTIVYQSIPWTGSALSGSVNLSWKLAPPPTGAYAGTYTISLTWKVESV